MAKYVLADGDTAATFLAGFNNNSDQAYAPITGVAGGQTIVGSTLTTENLTLRANAADTTTGAVIVSSSKEATSKTVGSVQLAGGLAVAKKIFGGATTVDSLTVGTLAGVLKGTAGAVSAATAGSDYAVGSTGLAGGQTIAGSTLTTENLTLRANAADTTTGAVIVSSSKEATSTLVGSVQLAGGLAVAKKVYAASGYIGACVMTVEGGFGTTVVAGENLVAGEVVCSLQTGGADGKVYKCPTSGNENDMPLGVVYANASANDPVIIITSGKTVVLPTAAVTAAIGYVLVASGTTAGRVDQAATAPAAATHFKEVGHFIAAGSGAGAATLAMVHFN